MQFIIPAFPAALHQRLPDLRRAPWLQTLEESQKEDAETIKAKEETVTQLTEEMKKAESATDAAAKQVCILWGSVLLFPKTPRRSATSS